MSKTINISQTTKKINLETFNKIINQTTLSYGKPSEALTLEPYDKEEDLHEKLLIIYQNKWIGRGFSFFLHQNENIELRLNYPCTTEDINSFYTFLYQLCNSLNLTEFHEETKIYSISEIENLTKETIIFNQPIIKEELHENLTIYGAIYPITLEKELIQKIKEQSLEEASYTFQIYLHEKQKEDYYYAKPLIYQKIYATYTLTLDVPTIFPIKPSLPLTYPPTKIKAWLINIISYKNNDYQILGVIPFENLNQIIKVNECPKFDANHIIIHLKAQNFPKIKKITKKFKK